MKAVFGLFVAFYIWLFSWILYDSFIRDKSHHTISTVEKCVKVELIETERKSLQHFFVVFNIDGREFHGEVRRSN